jgi:alanine-glyoxylate transaminase / serine-glyoxylate transaminase / serine-pyruvate transaminase
MLKAAEKRTEAPERFLFGPGPTNVDARVYDAMAQPIVGMRDPFFFECMTEVQAGLRNVFGTANPITFPLPGTGSSGMEAAIANFITPGAKTVVFANGLFADRQTEIAKRHGAQVVRFEKQWGDVFSMDEAEAFLQRERPQAVAFVQAETSTGAFQSAKAITTPARKIGAITIADCVTSLGAMPVEVDSNDIDVAYSCSQKGLSCPPGLSPITVSPRAWKWLESRESIDTWYLDLRLLAKWWDAPHVYHHTPPTTMIYAIREGLAVIEEEGLKNRWERHHRAHYRLVEGLGKLGFEPFVSNPEDRIWHLVTVRVPPGVNEAELRARLMDKYGIDVAAGIGKLSGQILRIGIMGPLATDEKVDFLLSAISSSI